MHCIYNVNGIKIKIYCIEIKCNILALVNFGSKLLFKMMNNVKFFEFFFSSKSANFHFFYIIRIV